MKGISAVLATVLIVVITVAIIGLAYGWATGVFQMAAGAGEAGVSDVSEDLQKSVQITAASCTNEYGGTTTMDTNYLYFTVKNTGTLYIGSEEMTFFADETNIGNEWTAVGFSARRGLEVDESQQYIYSLTAEEGETIPERDVVLKVDAPAGSVEETVTCPVISKPIGFP